MPTSYIATILITGICYVVSSGSPVTSVAVVMPNGTTGAPISTATSIAPHYTYVKYMTSQATSGAQYRKPDFTFKPHPASSLEWGVILLQGEAVNIASTGSGLSFNAAAGAAVGGSGCALPTCVAPPVLNSLFNDRQPFAWIVKRLDACPRCTDLPVSDLTPADSKRVGATFTITDGFLASGSIKRDPTGAACTWKFKPKEAPTDPEPEMELPQMVTVDMKTDNTLTLDFRRFSGGSVRPLKLEGTPSDRIVVYIGNAPLSDILEIPVHYDDSIDEHFQLYYKLLATTVGGHPYPHKVQTSCPVTMSHGNCPPMRQQ